MTRTISLYFREEGEQETNVTHGIHNTTSDSDISTSSTVETDERNTEVTTEVESLRNYDSHQSAVVEVVNFESLEIKIHELITTELDTQIKLDELIMLQKQQYTISFSLFIGLALIVILTIMYKVITFSFF